MAASAGRRAVIGGEPARVDEMDAPVFVDYIADMTEIPMLNWLRDTVGDRRVIFRSTSPMVQLSDVRRGVGIGMFPTYLADGDPTLHRVLENEARAKREFWLDIHEDLRDTPRMAVVFKFIKDVFAAHTAFYR